MRVSIARLCVAWRVKRITEPGIWKAENAHMTLIVHTCSGLLVCIHFGLVTYFTILDGGNARKGDAREAGGYSETDVVWGRGRSKQPAVWEAKLPYSELYHVGSFLDQLLLHVSESKAKARCAALAGCLHLWPGCLCGRSWMQLCPGASPALSPCSTSSDLGQHLLSPPYPLLAASVSLYPGLPSDSSRFLKNRKKSL